MTEQTAPATAAQIATITLDEPIKRDSGDITEVQLIRPQASALEGFNLRDLSNMETNAAVRLISRISNPTLLLHEVLLMDVADLTQMAAEISNFLLPRAFRVT